MKQQKRILITIAMIFLLAGCQLFPKPENKQVNQPVDVIKPPDEVVETPPEIIKKTDWNSILSPFVNKLLQSSSTYDDNKVILISDIQNRSGDYIVTSQVDEVLHQLMAQQKIFSVADRQSINQAKQALGISPDDKLVSRSKMIGIAKSMNAGYVLFTTIYKLPSDNNEANLAMELLSTQSGEILQRVTSKELIKASNTNADNVKEVTE
ncbi:penicillin-binding protein activator LpoB [Gilliamella sp. wkB112]|uniref:penicillin-binding protein activator LpoB n=1 Tax=Gilliamella sp. wkB112 TaxID=3120257 RepID=UPI00080DB677|nr:hypothetical protein [Gilliamella apicola]OCG03227.1 hypothetical protein A9G12_09990 [Gilliamella apicola]